MHVELRSCGRSVAAEDLPGPVLLVPEGLIASSVDENLILDVPPRGTDGSPDILAGAVPLLFVDPKTYLPGVAFLDVAPPPPFVPSDVEQMWQSGLSSPIPMPDSCEPREGSAELRGSQNQASTLKRCLLRLVAWLVWL